MRRRFNRPRVSYNSTESPGEKPGYNNLGVHTWDAFVKHAARRVSEGPLPGAEDSGSTPDSYRGWYRTPNLQSAVDLAVKGWPEGANEIAKTLDSIPTGEDQLIEWELDVQGAMPCVGAYLADDPECMWRFSQVERPAKRMTLIVPASYSSNLNSEEAMQYAKALAATARAIEASQIDVAIWSFGTGKGYGQKNTTVYAVSVRELGEPMDLAKVAFSSHPSWLRRIHFSWREMTPEAIKHGLASNGYAYPPDPTDDMVKAVLGNALEDNASALVILPSPNVCSGSGLLYEGRFDQLLQRFRTTVEKALEKKAQTKSA